MVLYPVIRQLLHKRVVLASASPRRREILSNTGLRFQVVPSRFNEKLDKASFPTPYAYAMETAKQKALEVVTRMFQKDLQVPDIVIGADTIVSIGGLILEKPVDKQDAYTMLSRLNGKEHSVYTGVTIIHCSSQDGQLSTQISEFYEETRVTFSQLSEELVWEYIHSGEPMDKAGGYGIQALGGMLVECIHGDFLNVVGFPLNRFCKQLTELYCPQHPEGLQQVQHSPVPTIGTPGNLSDLEGAGSNPAHREPGHGQGAAQVGAGRPQALGTKDADLSRAVDRLPPTALLELIDGFKASKALFTACEMKVFDLVKDRGPLSAVDVARNLDASESGTGWLLDVCVALGLLQKTERGYQNTELSDLYLLSDSEYSLHGVILHTNSHTWNLFTYLEFAIREGTSQAHRAFPQAVGDVFQDCFSLSQDKTLPFLRATHGLMKLAARRVATAFDLSRFTSACGLGGCTGPLAHELVRQYPVLKVTVFDLPEVIKHVACFQPDGPQTEQVSFVAGDFFSDRLPEADLYILARILHTWQDDKVHALLSRIAASCKPGGSLLVVETWQDETPAALWRPLQTLSTLVQTSGKERSLAQYRGLLRTHGFTDVRAVRTGCTLDAILATRAVP